jgi:hypothetical protein
MIQLFTLKKASVTIPAGEDELQFIGEFGIELPKNLFTTIRDILFVLHIKKISIQVSFFGQEFLEELKKLLIFLQNEQWQGELLWHYQEDGGKEMLKEGKKLEKEFSHITFTFIQN